jgi:hypothetical protein
MQAMSVFGSADYSADEARLLTHFRKLDDVQRDNAIAHLPPTYEQMFAEEVELITEISQDNFHTNAFKSMDDLQHELGKEARSYVQDLQELMNADDSIPKTLMTHGTIHVTPKTLKFSQDPIDIPYITLGFDKVKFETYRGGVLITFTNDSENVAQLQQGFSFSSTIFVHGQKIDISYQLESFIKMKPAPVPSMQHIIEVAIHMPKQHTFHTEDNMKAWLKNTGVDAVDFLEDESLMKYARKGTLTVTPSEVDIDKPFIYTTFDFDDATFDIAYKKLSLFKNTLPVVVFEKYPENPWHVRFPQSSNPKELVLDKDVSAYFLVTESSNAEEPSQTREDLMAIIKNLEQQLEQCKRIEELYRGVSL